MEYLILAIVIIVLVLMLKFIFKFNIKEIKEIGVNKKLDELTKKFPENTEICKWYLKKLNNKNVKIEEDQNSNATLYLVTSNKIFIANLKNSYTRIQTIAHECLHSIQSKKLLWFNFVFSNVYLIYFAVACVLAIFKILPCKMLFLSILMLLGFVYYAVRTYLENDAMIKARFLAKEYMQEMKISDQKEIDRIVDKYDELNNAGIRITNFKFLSNVLIKNIILALIFVTVQ